ncbi:MAG: hypothetical protein Q4Q22_08675, partial [Methanosphaera sp.]|nr:hypothetical protein [Methanosphaera sp.]
SANIGGAIYNDYDSKIIINKSNFINNSASDEAAAIYNNDSEIAVMNSNYTGNTPANFIINNNIIVLINDDEYITVGDETYYTKDDKIYYTVNGTNPDTFRNNTYVLSKEDVTISYDAIADTVYRDNVTITGKICETSGNPLQDVTVKITINNNEVYYNQTDSNGEFSLTTVVNRGGRNNVTIECYEDYYNSNKVNTTFNAEKLNAQITCDAIANAKYHDNVTITGKLQETNGNAIKNDTVKITVNNKETYYNQTDSNGVYRFTILANKTGINNVTVEYAGYNYNSQQVKKTFNVSKQSTQITIEAINITGYLGNITITGKLKESAGSPIQNAIINISINDEKYSAKTDKNGTYKLTTTANTVGTNNVKIVYEGNENYNRSEKTTTLNIPKQDTKITVKTVNTTIDNTQINITVTNKATGKVIPNAQIKIKLPNGTTITANTGSNGTVTQKLTLPAGTNKIIINYTGSNVYNPSNVTASVNVVKINTKITAKTVNSTIDNVSINVTLKTADNKVVSNAKISVYDKNNKLIANATTNKNGVANIKLNLTAGTQTLTVKYDGNGTYNASNATVSVNVVKRNTKVTGTVKNNTVSNTTLELTLTDTTLNKAISKATITVLDKNGKALANATTDVNGKATVKFNLTAGTQTMTIKYPGNGTYNASNTTVTVNVVKINTKLTAKTVNNTIGNVNINVTLKTTDNKVVSNAKISVYDKNNKVIANAATNGDGVANIKLNLTAGTQTLTVKYAGNGTYNASNT